jgi:oxygen-dependent protoporphyrinogen oxidase
MRPEEEIAGVVRRELGEIMGIGAEPDLVRVYRHPRAIPQYLVGHGQLLKAIGQRVERFPGLALTGNAYRGIGVNDCILRSEELAERITSSGSA